MANELLTWIKLTGSDFDGFARQLHVEKLTRVSWMWSLGDNDIDSLRSMYKSQTLEMTKIVFIKMVRHLFGTNEYYASVVIDFDTGIKDYNLYFTPNITEPKPGWVKLKHSTGQKLNLEQNLPYHSFGFSANALPLDFPIEWTQLPAQTISHVEVSKSKVASDVIQTLCDHKFAFQVHSQKPLSFIDTEYYCSFATETDQDQPSFFVYLMDYESQNKFRKNRKKENMQAMIQRTCEFQKVLADVLRDPSEPPAYKDAEGSPGETESA